MVLLNPEDNRQIDLVIQSLVEASSLTWNTIQSRFNLMVISQEQLETCLHNSSDYFRVRPSEDVNAFVMHVRHQCRVGIVKRLTQDVLVDEGQLANELLEQAGMFDIMAEEDVGYA